MTTLLNRLHRGAHLLRSIMLGLVVLVGQVAAEHFSGDSGIPGDGFPDIYYYQDSGLLQVDTDGDGLVAILVSTPWHFVHHENTSPCILCDGSVIEGQEFTVGYMNDSAQWVRVDPIYGAGPRGTIDLSAGFPGLTSNDFPKSFTNRSIDSFWSVIYASDRNTYETNVTIRPSGGSSGVILPPDELPPPNPDPTQSWTNPVDRLDVNDDGAVVAQDALVIINQLNTLGSRPLVGPRTGDYLDTDGDGFVAAIDALQVINAVNAGITRTPQAPASGAATAVPEPSSAWACCLGLLMFYTASRLPSGTSAASFPRKRESS